MDTTSRSRGIMTLAYGPARFAEQARSLALSLKLHAPHLRRALVTDSTNPEVLSLFTDVIPLRREWGAGVQQKFYFDRYSPYDETLVIDSDCLALGNLDAFWTAFAGQYFGVPGFRYLHRGDRDGVSFLDVDFLFDHFGFSALGKFNGGVYYFTRSPEATAFYETSRDLMIRWQELRLAHFHGGGPGEEAIYGIAMAIHGIGMTSMGNGGMWTPFGSKGPLNLDVLRGTCSFEKEGQTRTPEVVHFPGEYIYSFPYARERARLRKHMEGVSTPWISLAWSYFLYVLWQCSCQSAGLKKVARNSYRAGRKARRLLLARVRGA